MAPFTVFCDMSDKNGPGDSESRTHMNGCEAQGCHSRGIHYRGASLSQLASLTRVSSECEQFIKYECYHSWFVNGEYIYAWLLSHDSSKMTY